MSKSLLKQSASVNRTILIAGIALALGAFGVVVSSIFYALSPVAAALPIPHLSIPDALNGMVMGRITMMIAGGFGVISDIMIAVGALLLMIFRPPSKFVLEIAGWGFITVTVIIFLIIDTLALGVLPQLATLADAENTFAGFKLLYDTLFVLGTISFGLGAFPILLGEMQTKTPLLSKPLIWLGFITASVGLASGCLYFANISLPLVIGLSIGGGSLVFGFYGIRIAAHSHTHPDLV